MAKINKALFWSLFAAGGTVTAFVFPVLALVVLIAAHTNGGSPDIMSFDQIQGLLANWLAKLVALGIVSLALWHAAHRLRTALHGLGLRADGLISLVGYGVALIGTILTAYYLLQISV